MQTEALAFESDIGDLNGSNGRHDGYLEAGNPFDLSWYRGGKRNACIAGCGSEGLSGMTTELQNSEGASAEAAASMKDNMNGALDNAPERLNRLLLH